MPPYASILAFDHSLRENNVQNSYFLKYLDTGVTENAKIAKSKKKKIQTVLRRETENC